MFPLAIVFPVKPETNLLIKLDCMGIILIHAKIYRAALILCMQSVKKRKHRLFSISFSLRLLIMFKIMHSKITAIPIPIATTKTVFSFPIKGRLVMASAGLSHRGSIMFSKPKILPKRKPKIVEKNPQQAMIAARFAFLK